MPKQEYILYKIYYQTQSNKDELVYIGKTKWPLMTRLYTHFFKTPMVQTLDLRRISRIEHVILETEADLNVMEIIEINRYKPRLNKTNKARDQFTLTFPEVPFLPFDCTKLEQWKNEIEQRDLKERDICRRRQELTDQKNKMRKEIFSRTDLSADEKTNTWTRWLLEYHEPAVKNLRQGGK